MMIKLGYMLLTVVGLSRCSSNPVKAANPSGKE